jgi:hypothetical protein
MCVINQMGLGMAYKKPKPERFTKGNKLHCQKMNHKGGKPGTWEQCRFTVADGKSKYCPKHC